MIVSTFAVNGRTQVYGVIGNPVSHTFSPAIHNTLAAMLGENMAYLPFHVEEDSLQKALDGARALGIAGLNVTIPHKRAVIPFIAGLNPLAEAVGAVNTLVLTNEGYIGYNTDCIGLLRALETAPVPVKNSTALIIGSGGAGYAAAAALASEGAKKIYIANRTESHGLELVRRVKKYYNADMTLLPLNQLDDLSFPDRLLVVQSSAVGFGSLSKMSPVTSNTFFKKAAAVLDVIYSPWETEFLRLAKSEGCFCQNGFAMLVYQAISSFEIWRGKELERVFCENALAELTRRYIKEELNA